MPLTPSRAGRFGRALSLAVMLVVVIAACGGGASTPSGAASAASPLPAGPSDGATSPSDGGGAPSSSGTPDAALVARLEVAGATPEDAQVLALTRVEAAETGPRSAHVTQVLATGDTIDYDITVEPDIMADPGVATYTTEVTADRIAVELDYWIPADGLPDDIRDSMVAGILDGHLAGPGTVPAGPRTAEVDTVQVSVDWAISKASDDMRDASIEAIIKEYMPGKETGLMKLFKAGFAAKEGLELGEELDKLLAELDALRDCAENPTNQLTKQLYADDPSEKGRILDEIAVARVDVIANTWVMQAGVLNELLADAGPKWLGWVVSPANAWSKATLKDVNAERMRQLRVGIPKCDDECSAGSGAGGTGGSSGGSGGGSSGGGSGGSSGGGSAGASCQFPVTISGNVEVEIRRDGQTMYTAQGTGVRWRYDPGKSSGGSTGYVLEAGQLAWEFQGSVGDSSCPTVYSGSGSEPLVPDHEGIPFSEVGGPGKPREQAFLFIDWEDGGVPMPTYHGQGTIQLNGEVIATSCYGVDRIDANWPPAIRPVTWLSIPPLPAQPLVGTQMTGEYVEEAGTTEHIYRWDFTTGG